MPDKINSLDTFINAIERNLTILPDRTAYETKNKQSSSAQQNKSQLIILLKLYLETLKQAEKTPVIFKNDMKITQPQYRIFLKYIHLYNLLEKKFKQSHDPSITQLVNTIIQHMIGFKYRIEAIHGGWDKQPDIDENLLKNVNHLASTWKERQELYPAHSKKLSDRDLKRMKEVCVYPEFIRFLFSNKSLQNNFFNWIIRDNNGAAQFIEFPLTCSRLHHCLLDKRVGRLAPDELNIFKENLSHSEGYHKILRLPFSNGITIEHINILDESKSITLQNNYCLTLAEVFKIFAEKKNVPGNLEFFGTSGITNWSSFELGPWNPKTKLYESINLRESFWWKQLPSIEELSKEEIEKKYQITMNEGEWLVCLCASREELNYNFGKRHGYLEVGIPQNNGQYIIYPFGKFIKDYPTNKLLQALLIAQTVTGKIKYPDENIFYSHRQHATNPTPISYTDGMAIMHQIRNDLIQSLNNNLSFQLSDENCAHWAQKIVTKARGEKAPNAFKMPLANMLPTHKPIEKVIHAHSITQRVLIKGLQFFSSFQGKKFKEIDRRVYKTTQLGNTANTLLQYQPAFLNHQIEEGSLPGVITFGN